MVTVEKRRQTLAPSKYDDNDRFANIMGDFVQMAKKKTKRISSYAWNVFSSYKELGIFFR